MPFPVSKFRLRRPSVGGATIGELDTNYRDGVLLPTDTGGLLI